MSAPPAPTSMIDDTILACLACGDPFTPLGFTEGVLPIIFACGHTVCTECAEAVDLSFTSYSGKWACGIPACIANPSVAGDAGCVNAGVVALVQCLSGPALKQDVTEAPSKKRKRRPIGSDVTPDFTPLCDQASAAIASTLSDVERVNTARESMRQGFESSKTNFIASIDGLLQRILSHRDRVLGEAQELFDARAKALGAQVEELTVKVSLLRQAVDVCKAAVSGCVDASVDVFESVRKSVAGLTVEPFGGLSVHPVVGLGVDVEAVLKCFEVNAHVKRGVSARDCELSGPGGESCFQSHSNVIRLVCRDNRRLVVPDVDARDIRACVSYMQVIGEAVSVSLLSMVPVVDALGVFETVYTVESDEVDTVDVDVRVYGEPVGRCPVRVYKSIFASSTVLSIVPPGTLDAFSVAIRSWLYVARPQLLFRMSRDGTSTSDFHSRCDGKGPTVVLIRSDNGFVFGGYADKAWHSESKWIRCGESFIFNVYNPHGIPPTRYMMVNDSECALLGNASYGPAFGGSAIVVGCDGSLTRNCYTSFNYYTDTTGKDQDTFTGAMAFVLAELEVWQV